MDRYCFHCAGEREFERPPCPDGHGSECAEYACVGCGFAIVLGDVSIGSEVRTETRRVA